MQDIRYYIWRDSWEEYSYVQVTFVYLLEELIIYITYIIIIIIQNIW